MAYDVTQPPIMRTSEASRTTAEDMNRIMARVNYLVEHMTGTNPECKTDFNEKDIVLKTHWYTAVDLVNLYALKEYAPDITYSTHYKNLNNIELACWISVYPPIDNQLPFNMQEGNEWQN